MAKQEKTSTDNNDKLISRRGFFKLVGVIGVAVLAGSALAGCDNKLNEANNSTDDVPDNGNMPQYDTQNPSTGNQSEKPAETGTPSGGVEQGNNDAPVNREYNSITDALADIEAYNTRRYLAKEIDRIPRIATKHIKGPSGKTDYVEIYLDGQLTYIFNCAGRSPQWTLVYP